MDTIEQTSGLSKTDIKNDLYFIAVNIFNTLDLSKNTRKDYLYRTGLFVEFIADEGLGDTTFLQYKNYLGNRNDYTVSTKNKYLISAKVFCRELHKRGFFETDISQDIKSFKESKKHKREGLSVQDVEKVFSRLESTKTDEDIRAKAIITLLALQGLRQIEVSRLDVKDVDFITGVAMVQGKGADDKEIVYLNPYTLEVLKGYIQHYSIKSGALFTSLSNNSKRTRLSTRSIRNIVTNLLGEVGIKKNVHGFRHYFTTELIRKYKGDLSLVSNYTRHKSLETLQIYNDAVITKNDLPRFFGVFENITNKGIGNEQLQGI